MKIFALVLTIFVTACATTAEEFSDVIKLKAEPTQSVSIKAKAATNDLVSYPFRGSQEQVEVVGCVVQESAPTWVLMNDDYQGHDGPSFCTTWIAQLFMKHRFNVVGINRPSYGRSTGKNDYSGPQSIAAIEAAMGTVGKKHPEFKSIAGMWGYSWGATAALLYARKHPETPPLLLGGGLYDLEQVHKDSNEPKMRATLDSLVKNYGKDVYEERSIAWDFHGLPKKISLYHGEKDLTVPVGQATNFRDSLAAQEYKVTLKLLEKADHNLSMQQHQELIELLMAN